MTDTVEADSVPGGPPKDPASSIRTLFDGRRLTPVQRRIARCLMQYAADADGLSSAQVGELAAVSQPSVVRFATALGYPGYPELRKAIRALTRSAPVPAAADEVQRNPFQEAVAAETENLRAVEAFLADPGELLRAGRLASASRPLEVLGLRASAALAYYFTYFAAKVLPDVRVIDQAGTRLLDLLDQGRTAGATAMVAFDLPRWPRETTQALHAARARGYSVVTITDNPLSPQADSSDVVLAAPVGTSFVYDSHAAPMVLTMALVQAICDAEPQRSQRRMEEFEEAAAQRRYFHPREPGSL
ncbi:MAG: MurR/RpiR family transcriptional regulator [Streptosporangiaceae bacterium]